MFSLPFSKDTFSTDEIVFFFKKFLLHHVSYFFPSLIFVYFSHQKLHNLGGEDIFLEIISFDIHFTANLPPLAILNKNVFFSKRTRFFFKKA